MKIALKLAAALGLTAAAAALSVALRTESLLPPALTLWGGFAFFFGEYCDPLRHKTRKSRRSTVVVLWRLAGIFSWTMALAALVYLTYS